jgi:hypothetical protein
MERNKTKPDQDPDRPGHKSNKPRLASNSYNNYYSNMRYTAYWSPHRDFFFDSFKDILRTVLLVVKCMFTYIDPNDSIKLFMVLNEKSSKK